MFTRETKWHKRLPVMVFGVIALGIIIATASLIFSLFQKKSSLRSLEQNIPSQNSAENTSSDTRVQPQETPAELIENYQSALVSLQKDLNDKSATLSVMQLEETVEDILMSVRVPKEMRDAHLHAVLELRELDTNRMESKDMIRSIVERLIVGIPSSS